MEQKFQIGTTECTPITQRPKSCTRVPVTAPTGKAHETRSKSLHLGDDGFCTVRDVSARITCPSDRSLPFIWSVVRNSCRNDSEGGHALLRVTGSELQIHVNLCDGKST